MPREARQVPWLEVRDGVYYVIWYVKGRSKRLSLRTRIADEAQNRYVAFLRQGTDVYNGEQTLTVGQILSDYEREHVRGVIVRNGRAEPRMVAKQRTEICIGHLRRHLGNLEVKKLGVVACEKYLSDRRTDRSKKHPKRTRPITDSTIRRELAILVAAINHAVKRERVEFNTKKLELPKAGDPRDRWLTYAELDALRAAAASHPVVRDFIEIAYYTASRARAVETLTLFQVRLAENQIVLSKPDEVKTKKRRPVVPIDAALRPTIERLCTEAVDAKRVSLLPQTGPVLQIFKRIAREAGLSDDVTPHTLRHTRATHLLQKGVSVWHVAHLLGDTVATVDRVYGHHSTDAVAIALKAGKRTDDR